VSTTVNPHQRKSAQGLFFRASFFLFGSTAKLRSLPTSGFSNLPSFLAYTVKFERLCKGFNVRLC
jgi:hypothetical protein